MLLNETCWLCARNGVLWCLRAAEDLRGAVSFGTEVFYCEALGVGFEREDVDAYCRVLFLEERDLFGLDGIIYSAHVECGFVTGII